MQNMVVDVEVNLQIRREKLKAEVEENNTAKEKLNILIKKTEERMQKITLKDDFFAQNHHDTFIPQQEDIENHEQIPTNSNYNTSEDRFIKQYVEEKSPDLMCMFDEITYFDDLPKYDHYDDNYVLQSKLTL